MEIILFSSILISFILTLLILPKWIKKCNNTGLLWQDMNKFEYKKCAASGGIVVVMAFVLSILSYIAIKTFVLENNETSLSIFALLSVVLILSLVGIVDDWFGWQHGGISAKFRIFLAILASIPLIVINSGVHKISFPFLGEVNLGFFYPLFIVPLGVVGATATYNFLAGFNGLEAGQGIIILTFLSLVAYLTGSSWLSLIGLCMVSSLLVFYFYNKYPAKVFPGDSLTWTIGALIAIMAILGNFERIAVFIFIPYIIETILKSRGRLKKQSFGIPRKDRSLKMPYDKIYGLTHLSLFILQKFKRKVYERDVVYLIFIFQILLCLSALIIFRKALFL